MMTIISNKIQNTEIRGKLEPMRILVGFEVYSVFPLSKSGIAGTTTIQIEQNTGACMYTVAPAGLANPFVTKVCDSVHTSCVGTNNIIMLSHVVEHA